MPAKSYTADDATINAFLRNIAYVPAATVYLALFTVAPTAGTAGTEVVGNAYARQACAFDAPVNGATQNSAPATFPVAGPGAWGTIVAVAIMDDPLVGNILYFGNLAVAKVVGIGDQVSFATGALTVTEQ